MYSNISVSRSGYIFLIYYHISDLFFLLPHLPLTFQLSTFKLHNMLL